MTDTEQMPKTVLIPAVALMPQTNDIFIANSLTLSGIMGAFNRSSVVLLSSNYTALLRLVVRSTFVAYFCSNI